MHTTQLQRPRLDTSTQVNHRHEEAPVQATPTPFSFTPANLTRSSPSMSDSQSLPTSRSSVILTPRTQLSLQALQSKCDALVKELSSTSSRKSRVGAKHSSPQSGFFQHANGVRHSSIRVNLFDQPRTHDGLHHDQPTSTSCSHEQTSCGKFPREPDMAPEEQSSDYMGYFMSFVPSLPFVSF